MTSHHSCLYVGKVRHRRTSPLKHAFQLSVFMVYLDLAELTTVFRGFWAWGNERFALAQFRRRDHFGDPEVPLDQVVRDLIQTETGECVTGPIRVLTNLRYFGYCFNPISVFFCFNSNGTAVDAVVAEVSNTPWGERHCYVMTPATTGTNDHRGEFQFSKAFHVSPFMPMEQEYLWRMSGPADQLVIHMENRSRPADRSEPPVFDATLTLQRREISARNLTFTWLRFPWMTLQVMAMIYWQAMRLWIKGAPYFPHPDVSRKHH